MRYSVFYADTSSDEEPTGNNAAPKANPFLHINDSDTDDESDARRQLENSPTLSPQDDNEPEAPMVYWSNSDEEDDSSSSSSESDVNDRNEGNDAGSDGQLSDECGLQSDEDDSNECSDSSDDEVRAH
eukprot:SAG11_NODE_15415_length_579_cov_0.854167_1_plen_127_part_01